MLRVYIDSLTVSYGDSKESVSLIVVPDDVDLSGYVRLVDESGQPMALPEDGAVITKNAEQVMDFSLGDELHLQDSTLAEGTAPVSGIAMSYLGNTLYMTESAYEAAFGAPCEQNGVLAHLSGDAGEQVAFSEGLTADGRYLSVVSTQKLVNDFSSAFTLINTVVYVVIVLAAALSFTVVLHALQHQHLRARARARHHQGAWLQAARGASLHQQGDAHPHGDRHRGRASDGLCAGPLAHVDPPHAVPLL